MEINSICHIYFSPTGTSREIAHAVSRDLPNIPKRDINMTVLPNRHECIKEDVLAIIAVPVYGGRIAPTALDRLKNISGENTPAVIIAVYGNRSYDMALTELNDWSSEHGFIPVAAGAFIGEHSYSNEQYPIAAGRPDEKDINAAASWGQKIAVLLNTCASIKAISSLDSKKLGAPAKNFAMFRFMAAVVILKMRHVAVPRIPETDAGKCIKCGICAKICPTGAIDKEDLLSSDPKKCIRCCACVKGCPQDARTYNTPFASILHGTMKKRKEPYLLISE